MASAIETLLLAMLAGPGSPGLSQTDTSSINSGNVTAATVVTKQWPALPGTPVSGTVYNLRTEFNATWGGQTMAISADINGTETTLATIGTVPVTGAASGDAMNGWLDLTIRVVSATGCRLHLKGSLQDNTQNSARITNGTGCPISSTVTTGVTFAAADSIALAVAFGGSTTGQNLETLGSTFTVIA